MEHKESESDYKFDDDNELDKILFDGLVKLNLTTLVSNKFVLMMRYIQFIHISIKNDSTIRQIADNFKFQILNGSAIPSHYVCNPSIMDMIDCMGAAQKKLDYKHIAASEFYSLAEDAQKLNKIGARGYIVNVFDEHKVYRLFDSYIDMKKSPDLPMAALNTIDTGADATQATLQFMESIKKTPILCTSMALDGDGTNLGETKGVKGRVLCILLLSISAA